jgi:ankyrin repeat protein
VPLLELLLKGGAAVNSNPCPQLEKPFLQIAVERHNFRVVQCLLSAGANVNHRWESSSPGNVTALQAAVYTRNIDIVQLLLEWGANVNAPANNNGGKTALQTAVSQNHRVMTELLVHHGADVNGLPSPPLSRLLTISQQKSPNGQVTICLCQFRRSFSLGLKLFGIRVIVQQET